MTRLLAIASLALVLLVASCAPAASIQAEEFTTRLTYEQAYSETINVITTQPYPAGSSGWVIMQADQVGGFVSAQLTYTAAGGFLWLGTRQETATVSVTIVRRTIDTAVTVNSTNHNVAQDLAARIGERLGL